MIEPWEKLDSQYLGDFRIFRIRQDTSRSPRTGAAHRFFVLESPDWVNVIPLTPEGQVIMIRQYRHGTEDVTLEVPGGMVDEADADPSVSAARELREETGYEVEAIIHLGSVAPNPAFLNNQCHSYLALGVRPVHEVTLDGAEDIAFEEIPLAAIPDLIRAGAITHSLTITAFYYLGLYEADKKLTQRTQRTPSPPRELGVEWADLGGKEQNLTQRTQGTPSPPRELGVEWADLGGKEQNLTQRTQRTPSPPRELGVEWADIGGEEENLTQRAPSALKTPREGSVEWAEEKKLTQRTQSAPRPRREADDQVDHDEEQERLKRSVQSTSKARIENVEHSENDIAAQIVDAAFHIHRAIGPGLLESAYEALLSHELQQRGFRVARQVLLPVRYGDVEVDAGYRIDLLVDDKVIVELKSVEALSMNHSKQLLTYLRFADKRLGLLVNFGDAVFKHAIKRVVNGL